MFGRKEIARLEKENQDFRLQIKEMEETIKHIYGCMSKIQSGVDTRMAQTAEVLRSINERLDAHGTHKLAPRSTD